MINTRKSAVMQLESEETPSSSDEDTALAFTNVRAVA
jgi:hypothetical protein